MYVAYPRIAQHDVDASTLNITQLVITDPTPDSIHVTQTQVLGNKAAYHPTIYAFNATISMVGAAAPIATALVPQIQANDGQIIHVDQVLQLSDASAMADFSKAMLNNEAVELNFYGRPDLKEGGLPKKVVTFNKTVTLRGGLSQYHIPSSPWDNMLSQVVVVAGLNGLKGFNITSSNITSVKTDGTAMMSGTVYIPNPSVLTVAMVGLHHTLHIYHFFYSELTISGSARATSPSTSPPTAHTSGNPSSTT